MVLFVRCWLFWLCTHILEKTLSSVLWHCWMGLRKSILPVRKLSDEVLAWLSVWREVQVICMWSSWCHCHPIISCFVKMQIGLTFLVPAYRGCPGKEAVKRVSLTLKNSCVFRFNPCRRNTTFVGVGVGDAGRTDAAALRRSQWTWPGDGPAAGARCAGHCQDQERPVTAAHERPGRPRRLRSYSALPSRSHRRRHHRTSFSFSLTLKCSSHTNSSNCCSKCIFAQHKITKVFRFAGNWNSVISSNSASDLQMWGPFPCKCGAGALAFTSVLFYSV